MAVQVLMRLRNTGWTCREGILTPAAEGKQGAIALSDGVDDTDGDDIAPYRIL